MNCNSPHNALVCFRPAYARQVCEVDDLVSDLGIDEEKAKLIVDKAKDAQLFEKRKAAVQGTWKAVVSCWIMSDRVAIANIN